MISVQSSPIRAAPPDRRGPALRLRMKPAGALRGHIAGGWWPRSNDPATEFPALVSALGAWVGPVERISSDLDTWAAVARKAPVNGKAVRFEGFHWIAPKNAGKPKGATSAGRTSWNPAYRGDIEELADIGLIRSVSDSASPACAPSPSQCACRAILNPTVHGHDGAAPTCPKRMVAPIRDRLADSEVRTAAGAGGSVDSPATATHVGFTRPPQPRSVAVFAEELGYVRQ
ncbi:DUF5994 family protein [Lentzea albidocapillata]|uniref:Uncharacterized protein n=1 Tax=Lentzea albidocapillata TaxID=40571 RepID=A0A1W2DCL4_9PSEU|nr:DUF5994 family protein [Lentzea albidocapillata]SMC94846.1 hypothetical protein SAMN05660733_02831 [Lentzea albidocapillata]